MQLKNTIWAYLLNSLGFSVFKSCFVDANEDEYGDGLLSGPPITSFIFTTGVYIIIINFSLYPSSFRKPPPFATFIYEFLATAFLLEFSLSCLWTPIDLHIYTTFAQAVYKIFSNCGCQDVAKWIVNHKLPMVVLCYAASVGFLYVALDITNSIDFTIYAAHGPKMFAKYMKSKVLRTIYTELPPELNEDLVIRKKTRNRKTDRK